jgi:hypothetical protein
LNFEKKKIFSTQSHTVSKIHQQKPILTPTYQTTNMNPTKPYPQGIGDEDAQIRGFDGAQPNASQESPEGTERVTREVAEKTLRALQEMGAGYENIAGRMRDENSEPRSATTSIGVPANSYRPRYRPILPAPPKPVTQPIIFRYYFRLILPAPPQTVIVVTPAISDLVLPAHGPPVSKLTPTGRTNPLDHRPGSTISAAVPQQVKGFACTICHRALSSKGSLAEHIPGHNGEFACPECLASSG